MFKTERYIEIIIYIQMDLSVGFLISSLHPGETRLTEFKPESVRDARKMTWAGDGAGESMWLISSRRCHVADHQTILLNNKRR